MPDSIQPELSRTTPPAEKKEETDTNNQQPNEIENAYETGSEKSDPPSEENKPATLELQLNIGDIRAGQNRVEKNEDFSAQSDVGHAVKQTQEEKQMIVMSGKRPARHDKETASKNV